MGSAQVIQQGSAGVRVLVGVQHEQEVEVFLLNHVVGYHSANMEIDRADAFAYNEEAVAFYRSYGFRVAVLCMER